MEQEEKDSTEEANGFSVDSGEQENIKNLAERKLVSFCGQIMKEASDLQPSTGEAASADVHRVLDLRAPVIVKVYYILVLLALFELLRCSSIFLDNFYS